MAKKDVTMTDLVVRNSERTSFNRCRWMWWLNYHERWEPNIKSKPLRFGDLIHQALAAYYVPETKSARRRGPHPARTFEKLWDFMLESDPDFSMYVAENEEWVGARELGVEMLENYIDFYGKDKRILVLYPEMPFSVKLMFAPGLRGTYSGVADVFVFDLEIGKYGLMEHKTAAGLDTSHLFMDEQASSAWAVVPLFLKQNDITVDGEISFMLYNFLRKAGKSDRFTDAEGKTRNKPQKPALVSKALELGIPVIGLKVEDLMAEIDKTGFDSRLLGEVSKVQPAPLFKREIVRRGEYDRKMALQRIKDVMHEIYLAHNGQFPIRKSPDQHCKWCAFRHVCEDHEIGADWEELLESTFRKWDPYAQHVDALGQAVTAVAAPKIKRKKGDRRF